MLETYKNWNSKIFDIDVLIVRGSYNIKVLVNFNYVVFELKINSYR